MNGLARILTGSPAGDVETLLILLAEVATPRGLPVRVTIHAHHDRILVRLAATDSHEIAPGPGYGDACGQLHRLATRWGQYRRAGRNVWWAEIRTPDHLAATARPRRNRRNGEN